MIGQNSLLVLLLVELLDSELVLDDDWLLSVLVELLDRLDTELVELLESDERLLSLLSELSVDVLLDDWLDSSDWLDRLLVELLLKELSELSVDVDDDDCELSVEVELLDNVLRLDNVLVELLDNDESVEVLELLWLDSVLVDELLRLDVLLEELDSSSALRISIVSPR